MGFSMETRQAIGSWEELPEAEGSRGGQARRPMSLHYSDDKSAASARAKNEVLDEFIARCSVHPAVRSILSGVPAQVPDDELSWKHIAEQRSTTPIFDQVGSATGTPSLAAPVFFWGGLL